MNEAIPENLEERRARSIQCQHAVPLILCPECQDIEDEKFVRPGDDASSSSESDVGIVATSAQIFYPRGFAPKPIAAAPQTSLNRTLSKKSSQKTFLKDPVLWAPQPITRTSSQANIVTAQKPSTPSSAVKNSPACQWGKPNYLNISITDGADNAVEVLSGGKVDTQSRLLSFGPHQLVGLRFCLPVPRYSRILATHLVFHASESSEPLDQTTILIQAEASDNAPPFDIRRCNLSRRSTATQQVVWATTDWVNGSTYSSDNLQLMVQEVINRPGWVPGSFIAFLMIGKNGSGRAAFSYNGTPTKAPCLRIGWQRVHWIDPDRRPGTSKAQGPVPPGLPVGAHSLSIPIINGADDAVETLGKGSVALYQPGLSFMVGTLVGLRFTVPVSQQSIILEASLTFTCRTDSAVPVRIRIYAEATGNAAPFEAKNKALSKREPTMITARWESPPWVQGYRYLACDLQPVLQEVIDNDDWRPGNQLALFFYTETGECTAESCDSMPSRGPLLELSWQRAPPGSKPAKRKASKRTPLSMALSAFSAENSPSSASFSPRQGYVVGFRFQANVPRDAFVSSAGLSLVAPWTSPEPLQWNIYGERSVNAHPFHPDEVPAAERSRTTQTLVWHLPAWEKGQRYHCDGLEAILQEITSQTAWEPGSFAAFLLSCNTEPLGTAGLPQEYDAELHVDLEEYLSPRENKPSGIKAEIDDQSSPRSIFDDPTGAPDYMTSGSLDRILRMKGPLPSVMSTMNPTYRGDMDRDMSYASFSKNATNNAAYRNGNDRDLGSGPLPSVMSTMNPTYRGDMDRDMSYASFSKNATNNAAYRNGNDRDLGSASFSKNATNNAAYRNGNDRDLGSVPFSKNATNNPAYRNGMDRDLGSGAPSKDVPRISPRRKKEVDQNLVTVSVPCEDILQENLKSGLSTGPEGTDVELRPTHVTALHFSLPVPAGARIESAILSLNPTSAVPSTPELLLYCATLRNVTESHALWKPASWIPGQVARCHALIDVLQEVVTQPRWKKGNGVIIRISTKAGSPTVSAETHTTKNGPTLEVMYCPPKDAPAAAPPKHVPENDAYIPKPSASAPKKSTPPPVVVSPPKATTEPPAMGLREMSSLPGTSEPSEISSVTSGAEPLNQFLSEAPRSPEGSKPNKGVTFQAAVPNGPAGPSSRPDQVSRTQDTNSDIDDISDSDASAPPSPQQWNNWMTGQPDRPSGGQPAPKPAAPTAKPEAASAGPAPAAVPPSPAARVGNSPTLPATNAPSPQDNPQTASPPPAPPKRNMFKDAANRLRRVSSGVPENGAMPQMAATPGDPPWDDEASPATPASPAKASGYRFWKKGRTESTTEKNKGSVLKSVVAALKFKSKGPISGPNGDSGPTSEMDPDRSNLGRLDEQDASGDLDGPEDVRRTQGRGNMRAGELQAHEERMRRENRLSSRDQCRNWLQQLEDPEDEDPDLLATSNPNGTAPSRQPQAKPNARPLQPQNQTEDSQGPPRRLSNHSSNALQLSPRGNNQGSRNPSPRQLNNGPPPQPNNRSPAQPNNDPPPPQMNGRQSPNASFAGQSPHASNAARPTPQQGQPNPQGYRPLQPTLRRQPTNVASSTHGMSTRSPMSPTARNRSSRKVRHALPPSDVDTEDMASEHSDPNDTARDPAEGLSSKKRSGLFQSSILNKFPLTKRRTPTA